MRQNVNIVHCSFFLSSFCGIISVPPQEPLIFESSGLSLRGEVGPYREGSTLDLTCIVRDGKS